MAEAYTLLEHAPLARLNTFRVAAEARWLATVHDAGALPTVLDTPQARGPVMVLGEGSNVLFAGDFDGLVVQLHSTGLASREDDGGTALVRAEAGVNWDAFVDWTLARGLAGLENLALIPGLVGAAPIQNIGAYGVEVAGSIEAVDAWDRSESRPVRIEGGQCAFGYRDSRFKREPDRWIVTAVEFRLSRQSPLRLEYAGVREELAAMGIAAPTHADVAEAVRRLRPRVVVLQHWVQRHPDHAAASRIVYDASFLAGLRNYRPDLGPAFRPAKLVYAVTMTEANDIAPSFVVDVTSVWSTKMRAVEAFRSQFTPAPDETGVLPLDRFREAIELAGRRHGQRIGVRFGEGFVTREPMAVDDLLSLGGSSL